MLIQSAIDYNVEVHIMDPDANAPCKDIAHRFVQASLQDEQAILDFGRQVDILTIEIENVNTIALQKLVDEGVKVYPEPAVITLIQDKGLQKAFYRTNNIPTAPFRLVEDRNEMTKHEDMIPFFQKLRKEGYDGRGVKRIGTREELFNGFDAPSVLETEVPMAKEISVIVARNVQGEVKSFDPVELHFDPELNLVDYLFAPSSLNKEQENEAIQLAEKVITALDMHGLLAVEMFMTPEGEILVNEVAPRPHNSGHHSIKACISSQFEQMLRAIFDLPLGDPTLLCPAVMLNLLGEKGYDGIAKYEGLDEFLAIPGADIHLYGKLLTRPGRKMGHATILGRDLEDALEKAKFARRKLKIIA